MKFISNAYEREAYDLHIDYSAEPGRRHVISGREARRKIIATSGFKK